MSLRGAFFASLPQHDLSRGGNLEAIDKYVAEIAKFIPSSKARLLRLRLAMTARDLSQRRLKTFSTAKIPDSRSESPRE
jgi:hypothetical protein